MGFSDYKKSTLPTNTIELEGYGIGQIIEKRDDRYLKVCFKDEIIELDYFHYSNMISFVEKVSEAERCYSFLEERKVKFLVHFTHIANLPGILNNGIVPRDDLPPEAKVTDEYRYDGHTDCSCLSISYPNYFMLYKNKDNYIILLINPVIIKEINSDKVKYYPTNAASNEAHSCITNGLSALENMFAPIVQSKIGTICRTKQNLPKSCTTDPQAEIQIQGIVDPRYIVGILTLNKHDYNIVTDCINNAVFKGSVVLRQIDRFWPKDPLWNDYKKLFDDYKKRKQENNNSLHTTFPELDI